MTRGHPPVVAIEEAMHYAERIGFMVIGVYSCWPAFAFMAISEGKITRVRVRRLRSWALRTAGYPAPGRSWNSAARQVQKTPAASSWAGCRAGTDPVFSVHGQERSCGDVRHVSIPAPGTTDGSGRVTGGGRDSSPFYYLKPEFRMI